MTTQAPQAVQVERNGIKLAWNVLAVLGGVSLGFYVSAIVAPIQADGVATSKAVATLTKEVKALQTEFEVFKREAAVFSSKVGLQHQYLVERDRECLSRLMAIEKQRRAENSKARN